MTLEEVTKNINAQPVGRATLVVNDKCADPSNYLYKLNYLARRAPQVVRSLAIAVLRGNQDKDDTRKLVDVYYDHMRNL